MKIAVIGVGYLGRFHALKYASMEDVDLIGVVDIDPSRAHQIAQEAGTDSYTSPDGILDHLDAVSIAVPTSVHADVAIPFLEKGIAVLLEKPISARIEDAVSIINAAQKGNAVLQIGHLERFNPALKKLKSSIRRPMFIEAHRISPFRQRGADVDVILDIMIHDIDIILSLVGSSVESVESVGVPVLTGSVDIANARIKFASGCIANITASRVSADVMRKIRIFQSDSYISIDFAKSAVDIYTLTEQKTIDHTHLTMDDSDALASEIRSFVDAVRDKGIVEVDGQAGLKAIEMAYLIKDRMIVP
ncbi:MAG: Gfo/Idh/MocA family protein [Desulfomonilia bacterium]